MEYYVPSIWHTISAPKAASRRWAVSAIASWKTYHNLGHVNYSMTLVRLNQDETGKVTGAIFTDAKGLCKINAENVILATGGSGQ
ncbi:MAG: hypothetical protein ACLVJ6_09235 [Merdibacter sp.]